MQQLVTPAILRLAMALKGLAALVVATFCWGLAPVISKNALTYLPPLTVLVVQLAASSAILWVVTALLRTPLPPLNRDTLYLTLLGLLAPGLTATLLILGLTHTTATNAALLVTIEPIIIIFLAWLLLRERVTALLVGLAALASTGVILVVGSESPSLNNAILGNVLLLMGSGCLGLYVVLMRWLKTTYVPLLVVTLQQTAGLILAIIIWTFSAVYTDTKPSNILISFNGWSNAIASGIMEYGLAFWCYSVGLRTTSASVAASFLNLTPVFGIGGAYLILGERLHLGQWLGAAIILVAVVSISKLENAPE